jgi:hypothetical protein
VCVFLSWIKERKKKFRKEARDCETVFQVRSPEDRHLYRCLDGTHYQNSATALSTEQQVPYSLVSHILYSQKIKRRETHLPNAPASTKTRAIQKKPYSRERERVAPLSLSLW